MAQSFDPSLLARLGPLAPLAGSWMGETGVDDAIAADRGPRQSRYREVLAFEPFGPVENHEQQLYGLRYSTKVWRVGEPDPYHEELGYWLWDAAEKQVLRCFLVPRGMSVIAGGTVEPDARDFSLAAEVGSPTYGIASNRFLDREFRTVRYELRVQIVDENTFRYDEDTQILMRGKSDLFHHRDGNTVKRVP